jgi:hypothetical protein
MAKLRFRVELNKGGTGVTMAKLASVTQETEKFLQMLLLDIAVENRNGKWIAKDFENNSVDFNVEWVGFVETADERKFNNAVEVITSTQLNVAKLPSNIKRATVMQYSNIAKSIDEDEVLCVGLFDENENAVKEIRPLSKQHSIEIQQNLKVEDKLQYLGSIQGIIHSIITEGKDTTFKLRELSSDELVVCNYNKTQYDAIVDALKKQGAVVHVQGWITASKLKQKRLFLDVEKIKPAVEYVDSDVDKFIGLLADKDLSGTDNVSEIH